MNMLGPATSSGLIAASGVVSNAAGLLHSVLLVAGSDTATIIIYDNASAASGTVLCKLSAVTGTTAQFDSATGVVANAGLYAAITGTSPGTVVHFNKG